jgi:hypothetical protein
MNQPLLRAVLFRICVAHDILRSRSSAVMHAEKYQPVIDAIGGWTPRLEDRNR